MQFKRQLGCRPTCNRVRGSGTRQQRWRETWEMQCLWPRIRLCSASEDAHEGQAQCEARWGQLAIGRRMGESGSVLCVQMCCVCADDKLFGGKRCCGTFGDKSPFHYEHKFQQKASFSNMIYSIPWFYRLFKRRSDILLVWKNARISDISKFWAFGFANLEYCGKYYGRSSMKALQDQTCWHFSQKCRNCWSWASCVTAAAPF